MTNSPLAPPVPAPPNVSQPARQLADGSHVPALQATLAAAQNQLQSGDLDGAGITLERAQRMAPQSATVYQRLADVRLRQGRPAEAEQLLRKALGFAASSAQAAAIWRSLAVAEQRQGNAAGAADAQNRAAALDGN
jgi:tetratricopeptide (TPR) repeat protein